MRPNCPRSSQSMACLNAARRHGDEDLDAARETIAVYLPTDSFPDSGSFRRAVFQSLEARIEVRPLARRRNPGLEVPDQLHVLRIAPCAGARRCREPQRGSGLQPRVGARSAPTLGKSLDPIHRPTPSGLWPCGCNPFRVVNHPIRPIPRVGPTTGQPWAGRFQPRWGSPAVSTSEIRVRVIRVHSWFDLFRGERPWTVACGESGVRADF